MTQTRKDVANFYDCCTEAHVHFVWAAMRSTRFLCGAIAVTAVVAILSDVSSERITLHLWDAADLLMVLLVAIQLRVAGHDESRPVIKGMLFGIVMLLLVMYTVG